MIILTTQGCENFEVAPKADILGSWKWINSSGGIDGRVETPSSTGYEVYIEFTNKKFRKYLNGALVDELSYSIQEGQSIRTTGNTEPVAFENGTTQSIELYDNKLILYDECFDCFQHEYVRE